MKEERRRKGEKEKEKALKGLLKFKDRFVREHGRKGGKFDEKGGELVDLERGGREGFLRE